MYYIIINEVVINDAPWLLESPLSNIPKHIQIEEIIKDEFIQILAVDYVDTYCKVGGVCPYYKKNNPKEVYEHCLTLQKFDEIDKKIIAFALDRKPYYRNQSLRGRKVESIEKVIIDREREFIGFEGPGLDSGFNQIPFLLYLFSDEYDENLYEKSIETKKKYVHHSKRFEKFVPDFESEK